MSEPDWSREGVMACLAVALTQIGLPADEIEPDASLADDLGLDSFQLMQVARHMETAYQFRFSLADWALAEEEGEDSPYLISSLLAFVNEHRPAEGKETAS
jgi:acyl carrier protein